jgi:hypothetical protein
MARVGFEPTVPAFERARTVHAPRQLRSAWLPNDKAKYTDLIYQMLQLHAEISSQHIFLILSSQ